ncbi:Rubrerythrin [Desulfofarcimen acetoxidans DSM 771]|jgi:rubrerythrin|uniref:Rubrerythrin n=1 Tax=Desulfofarcimen acetoxidans (strain ATCC 49208 / DSM 771 / KCTC 5769 / VKM B-1644 / 5575) TaxID=485916 RepID=C8VVW1_DESAS|nr:rubrerythrin family protein [Desulfofarcimen acetoxidans]ACV64248.1 Rubrerythrin [Desulfofarcimen acetoxidans DSM 771]
MAAFAGESQANRKYLAFAKKAQHEGKEKIARLFTAAAEAETIHALKHLDVAGKVSSTSDNLKVAVEGETYESDVMYPQFIEQAKADNNQRAFKTFDLALGAEKVHAELYQKALKDLEATGDLKAESIHLCPICGYIELDHAPERCPVCGAKGSVFKQY